MGRYLALALFGAFLLSGCDNQNSPARLAARIDDADFNATRALAAVEDLESRVTELETRIEELEASQ